VKKVHDLHQEYTEESVKADKAEKDVTALKEHLKFHYDRAEEESERAEKAEEERNFEHDRTERFVDHILQTCKNYN